MIFRNAKKVPVKSGFTLIELLVVIAILATLVGLGAMAVTRTLSGAEDTQRSSFGPIVESAVAAYKSENGEYPLPDGGGLSSSATPFVVYGQPKDGQVENPNAPILLKLFGRRPNGERDTEMRAYITDTSDLYVRTSSGRVTKFDEALAAGSIGERDNIGYRLRMDETNATAFRDVSGRMAFAPIIISFDFDLDRASVTVPGRNSFNLVMRIGN